MPTDLTDLFNAGLPNRQAADELWQDHNDELRKLAGQVINREQHPHSLQATALVNEAYIRMIDRERVTDEGTAFFRLCFATECRRILVDHARKRKADKRGGGAVRHSLSEADARLGVNDVDVIDLHEAIEALGKQAPRKAQVVDMRVFGGMTVPQCALALGVASGTIDNDWAFARAWLRQQLADPEQS